jgi:menaquinone-dependent protoporphyrinogen oxidase
VCPGPIHGFDGYDAAVIGSAMYGGHWIEPARELVERHKVALTRIPPMPSPSRR